MIPIMILSLVSAVIINSLLIVFLSMIKLWYLVAEISLFIPLKMPTPMKS